jgi:predicted MFS family arabinose efflux permease
MIAVLVPLSLLHRAAPTTGALPQPPLSLQGVLRCRVLWTLCAAHLCMSITMTMVNVHLVEFFVSGGILDLLQASTIFSAVSLVSLGGRMFFGWLVDRLHATGAFTVAMSCTMTGFVMLLLLTQVAVTWPLYVFVLIYGFAQGAGGIAVAARTVEFFRGPYLGTLFMVVNLSANLGSAFGAWFGGQLFDLSGSYALTFLTAVVCGALAIGSMWLGHAYRQQPA